LALALETKPPFSIAATSDAVPNAADDATDHATDQARTTRIDELKARHVAPRRRTRFVSGAHYPICNDQPTRTA
jgi:hypothetical protein